MADEDLQLDGSLVLVAVGGALHCVGRVDVHDGRRVWVDVNIMGTHLPQGYGVDEVTPIPKPSDVLGHGLCPSCVGFGIVENMVKGASACSACRGSGRLGVWVEVQRDAGTTTAQLRIDTTPAGLTCDVCRDAYTGPVR